MSHLYHLLVDTAAAAAVEAADLHDPVMFARPMIRPVTVEAVAVQEAITGGAADEGWEIARRESSVHVGRVAPTSTSCGTHVPGSISAYFSVTSSGTVG